MSILRAVAHVLVSMLPLYVALFLGYGSMAWWNLFNPEQSEGIHTFVCYITLPLYTLQFIANSNPYQWNFRFLAADILSKLVIIIALAIWTKYSNKGNYPWAITGFSLSTLTNAFVVGVPLVQSMYGSNAVDIVVQSSTIQAIIWLTIFLFILELRRTTTKESTENEVCCTGSKTKQNTEYDISDTVLVLIEDGEESFNLKEDVQESGDVQNNTNAKPHKTSFLVSLRTVFLKLRRNPNAYCSVVGLIWALIANRFHWKMPSIMEGSILILSRAGTGAAMFSMGLFMAMQEKLIACGTKLTVVGIVLRFLVGPAAMAICCLAVGLRGDVLRVAIIQAALPQSITSFVYAKDYGLHPDVLSTSVVLGLIVCLPILLVYYGILSL